VCGLPAVNVPVHVTADGLPMGIQLIGRTGSELQLLQLAAALGTSGGH
jgi:amidase